ncbi:MULTISPECIES: hypothetical protein [unclassified Spirosoma]|uniref:hypothetical protein n=1 Tax=unclassified Spirosoma TaxID=2621999 RepID=UPI001AD4A578|nr:MULTISPECIES: hypothetical protein [unclassified Spirosoma]MBN8825842.1 hypothetical protein [Spirosoma sp.]
MQDKKGVSDCIMFRYLPKQIDNEHKDSALSAEQSQNQLPISFKASVRDIVKAIATNVDIQGVNLVDRVQDPGFRFTSEVDPDFGTDLSEAFAVLLARARALASQLHSETAKKGGATSSISRNEHANAYAAKMFGMISDLKSEHGISTYQAVVDLLNDKKVETAGGKTTWHIKTLQNLEKRWQNLGLVPSKPKLK